MPRVHETLRPEGVRARAVPVAHTPVQCPNVAVPLSNRLVRIVFIAGDLVSLRERKLSNKRIVPFGVLE